MYRTDWDELDQLESSEHLRRFRGSLWNRRILCEIGSVGSDPRLLCEDSRIRRRQPDLGETTGHTVGKGRILHYLHMDTLGSLDLGGINSPDVAFQDCHPGRFFVFDTTHVVMKAVFLLFQMYFGSSKKVRYIVLYGNLLAVTHKSGELIPTRLYSSRIHPHSKHTS